jgi:hypothetical protein
VGPQDKFTPTTREHIMNTHGGDTAMMDIYPSTETGSAHDSLSPTKSPQPKQVSFELLLLPQSPQHKARLPMRVNIYPHDTTDSIITTVKNFYGLYERKGVVFEDRHGNTLIARYENFAHNMVVFVRVTAGSRHRGFPVCFAPLHVSSSSEIGRSVPDAPSQSRQTHATKRVASARPRPTQCFYNLCYQACPCCCEEPRS